MQSGQPPPTLPPIGSLVTVTNAGHGYSSYVEMAKGMKLNGFRNGLMTNGQLVEVVAHGVHKTDGLFNLLGVRDLASKQEYIIRVTGVTPKDSQLPAQLPAQLPPMVMQHMWQTRTVAGDVRLVSSDSVTSVAHSCVLVAVSPVFAAALQTGMKEAATNEIKLPSTPNSVVEGVLEMIYLGSVPSDIDLLAALRFAHMYDMFEVSKPLADSLLKTMTCDTAAEVMRMLRDFDTCTRIPKAKRSRHTDNFLAAYRNNDELMRAVISGL
eukprot:TRINITY_DN37880_c0_g1_i1.p1 TRINITY_DN37880_c0_g1~~TRINITY_DN37880_c0_g1_i1.p1  ORF type:complete len:267 (-),score=27.09 TRINITY_DN37880_c0_g1_i1:341-1141(-)